MRGKGKDGIVWVCWVLLGSAGGGVKWGSNLLLSPPIPPPFFFLPIHMTPSFPFSRCPVAGGSEKSEGTQWGG